jgi:two-component system cell cycle response regulator DivK
MHQLDKFAEASGRETVGRISISTWHPTILIAEDSADAREMMQLLLELKGYQVIAAENGIRALEMAISNEPNALLLDLQLPKLDGLAVTRNLRLNPAFKNVPIIITSGHDPNRYRQEAMDAGCDDYFLKPIDFERLQLVLDRMVSRERRMRVKCA